MHLTTGDKWWRLLVGVGTALLTLFWSLFVLALFFACTTTPADWRR